jgi:energy-coupling factor transporter ATP-binding protein EcfA2
MTSRNRRNGPQDLEGQKSAVRARGLTFTYDKGAAPALDGIDLTLPAGEAAAVVGASGAGKSTLCLTTNSLAPRFVRGRLDGELQVLGVRMGDIPVQEMSGRVGMVLQDFEAQLFSTSAELEVAFGLENLGVPRERMREIVPASLEKVRLAGFEKRDPSTLSGGEKQRLALAAVLAMEPSLLVMDEPTSDLDPQGRREIMAIARGLAGGGRTTLIVEHETDELLAADVVFLLEGGRLVASGPPAEIFAECERLRAAGVRPPQLAELCSALGLDSVPRDLEEAQAILREAGRTVDRLRCLELERRGIEPVEAPTVVSVSGVAYSHDGRVDALCGVDLQIARGEFVAVVGVNGSGKTTLVKHFNGLLLPKRGRVEIDGMDTRRTTLSVISQRVGHVFQNPDHQIFCESVADELAFGPRNAGMDAAEIARRSARALTAVRMEGSESADPFALTKGERQRLALASVLVMEPSVIVMDEPTTGLDFTQQEQVMELLVQLNRKGHTIVIVTHSLWLAAQYARRTIVMSEGRIVADGPTRQVMALDGAVERRPGGGATRPGSAGGGRVHGRSGAGQGGRSLPQESAGGPGRQGITGVAGGPEPEGLERWSLVSPPAVALGRLLGAPVLTVSELAYCLGADTGDDTGGAHTEDKS